MPDNTLPSLSPEQAQALIERIETIPLYSHAYSFHRNFRFGDFEPCDLLDFAAKNGHKGIKIHREDGGGNSLGNADALCLSSFEKIAKQLGQDVHLEISETEVPSLREAIRVGSAIGATSIRCYPRYEGKVSSIIERTIRDLQQLKYLDPDEVFRLTLEQHEDLTGSKLVRIVEAVGNPNLSLMFDFTNMINAYEHPLDALQTMAKHITDVHVKDAVIFEDSGGWGQRCCRSGDGDIPQARLLMELLCLGENAPQVLAYGLEEEVGYHSPPFRYPYEDEDPYINARSVSETDLVPGVEIATQLAKEMADAQHLCTHIQELLKLLRNHAASFL